jgi:hypothetical protein
MILALSAAMPFNAWALEVNTEISASQVAVGESVILTIRVGGDVGDLQPEALPDVQGLEISFSGTERSYRNINGRSWRSTSLTFSVEPLRRGNFIYAITVKAAGNRCGPRGETYGVDAEGRRLQETVAFLKQWWNFQEDGLCGEPCWRATIS